MNRPIAYGFATFLAAWAVAAIVYDQLWVGVGLFVLAVALVLWVGRNAKDKS